MKSMTVLWVALLTAIGSLSPAHAETKLLWRTGASGATIVPNSKGTLVTLGQVDVSQYDRIRLVAVARRPSNVPLPNGFGAPLQLELHIGEGTDDLGLLESGVFALNPTGTSGAVPAHTERTTGVFENPVITTLIIEAVGPITGNQQTVMDIFVYGQRPTVTTNP